MCQRNATHSDWIWYLMENYCTCEYSARISASGMYIGSGILFTLIYKTDKVKLLYEKVLNRNSSLTFFFLSYQYFFFLQMQNHNDESLLFLDLCHIVLHHNIFSLICVSAVCTVSSNDSSLFYISHFNISLIRNESQNKSMIKSFRFILSYIKITECCHYNLIHIIVHSIYIIT